MSDINPYLSWEPPFSEPSLSSSGEDSNEKSNATVEVEDNSQDFEESKNLSRSKDDTDSNYSDKDKET